MGKQTFTKITKILSFLLLVSFIMSVTAASASAISVKGPVTTKLVTGQAPNTATKSATMTVTKTVSNMAKKGF